jgi:hypothetical protein
VFVFVCCGWVVSTKGVMKVIQERKFAKVTNPRTAHYGMSNVPTAIKDRKEAIKPLPVSMNESAHHMVKVSFRGKVSSHSTTELRKELILSAETLLRVALNEIDSSLPITTLQLVVKFPSPQRVLHKLSPELDK